MIFNDELLSDRYNICLNVKVSKGQNCWKGFLWLRSVSGVQED